MELATIPKKSKKSKSQKIDKAAYLETASRLKSLRDERKELTKVKNETCADIAKEINKQKREIMQEIKQLNPLVKKYKRRKTLRKKKKAQ